MLFCLSLFLAYAHASPIVPSSTLTQTFPTSDSVLGVNGEVMTTAVGTEKSARPTLLPTLGLDSSPALDPGISSAQSVKVTKASSIAFTSKSSSIVLPTPSPVSQGVSDRTTHNATLIAICTFGLVILLLLWSIIAYIIRQQCGSFKIRPLLTSCKSALRRKGDATKTMPYHVTPMTRSVHGERSPSIWDRRNPLLGRQLSSQEEQRPRDQDSMRSRNRLNPNGQSEGTLVEGTDTDSLWIPVSGGVRSSIGYSENARASSLFFGYESEAYKALRDVEIRSGSQFNVELVPPFPKSISGYPVSPVMTRVSRHGSGSMRRNIQ